MIEKKSCGLMRSRSIGLGQMDTNMCGRKLERITQPTVQPTVWKYHGLGMYGLEWSGNAC